MIFKWSLEFHGTWAFEDHHSILLPGKVNPYRSFHGHPVIPVIHINYQTIATILCTIECEAQWSYDRSPPPHRFVVIMFVLLLNTEFRKYISLKLYTTSHLHLLLLLHHLLLCKSGILCAPFYIYIVQHCCVLPKRIANFNLRAKA